MSTSLYWSLVPKEPDENNLYELKRIMAKKLGEFDGSVGEDLGVVNSNMIPFLEGIVATDSAAASDAQELIDAIQKYGQVQLSIH